MSSACYFSDHLGFMKMNCNNCGFRCPPSYCLDTFVPQTNREEKRRYSSCSYTVTSRTILSMDYDLGMLDGWLDGEVPLRMWYYRDNCFEETVQPWGRNLTS